MSHNSVLGPKLDPITLEKTLEHIFRRNNELGVLGTRGTPVCIWGTHGIGKTQIVKDFAIRNGWHFAYCAPAQFEEMGDLHGLPTVYDPTPEKPDSGDEYTIFAPPEWVPKEPGPGILLLDDINRADDRILRGIMQLLQNFEMFSWQLPQKWQIVATANPDGGDYSVTTMDEAMVTRMMNFTLTFDVKSWAKWATIANVDPRGINFVMNFPETVTGKRTTPRTLVHFFEQIKEIKDLKANIDLVAILAASCLDETTVAAFVSFLNDEFTSLFEPEDILNASKPTEWKKRFSEIIKSKNGGKRVDRITAICTRLLFNIINENKKINEKQINNFCEFLIQEEIPNDLRISIIFDMQKSASKSVPEILKDKRLSKIIMDKL